MSAGFWKTVAFILLFSLLGFFAVRSVLMIKAIAVHTVE